MIEFSASLASNGLPTEITSEADVDAIIAAFDKHIDGLNFWQYYVFDVKAERESVKAALSKGDVKAWPTDIAHKSVVELAEIARKSDHLDGLGIPTKRGGPHVDGALAASIVKSAFVDIQDVEALADAWVRVVDVLNVPLYATWKDDMKAAVDQIKNRLKYIRLDPHGPKRGKITKE